MPPIVTLTTDFEEREPFVASVKGELCTRCPGVQVIDLSHQIPRGDIMEGALFLATAVPRFPEGTIHVVGIAPGPIPVVVSIDRQVLVCADNGLVSVLAERYEVDGVRRIAIPETLASSRGQIFYTRDVFAPTAARLAAGAAFEELGEALESVTRLDLPRPSKQEGNRIQGQIMHVDRFGNLITNIHRSHLDGFRAIHVEVGLFPIGPLSEQYSDVAPGKPLALFGLSDYLEIAYNKDRADARLGMGKGIIVSVTIEPDGA